MARAVFGGGLSPYITKAQDRPTPYNPLGALSTAIRQPFVEDVIVPGISRIRDEMRIAEQEEQIAAQAEAKRAAAAQFLQQAAAAEQQGLDAEVAAAVSGVDVPMVSAGGEASTPLSNLATGLRNITTPAGMYEDMRSRYIKGFDAGLDLRETAYDAVGEEIAGPFDHHGEASLRAAMMFERMYADLKRGRIRAGSTMKEDMDRMGKVSLSLRKRGLGDIVAEIVQGATAEEAFMAAGQQLQQTQQRRGEQEAAAAATQRFERALAGELPQVAAQEAQAAMPIKDGKPRYPTGAPTDDPRRLARRAYEKHLKTNPGDQEGAMAAAQQAFGASAPQPAAQPQAIQSPELIERANRLRQQATDMEREATGIEGTPVYRTFGDHAMAFLEALETGDVAKQNALMASVGGSTDYQPAGKGAVGEAMSKDASMRARRDLLELKKDWLKAQRREKTGLKLINARKKKETAKTGRAIARSGMGAAEFDKLFMTSEFDKKIGTRQDRTIEYDGQTIDITYSSDPSGALQQLQSLSRYVRGKKTRRELQGRFSKIGTRISGTEEGTAATTKKAEETEEQRESKKTAADKKAAKKRSVAIDKEVFGLRGDLVDIAADLLDARTERDKLDKEDLDDMTNQPAQAAAAAVRFLTAEQGRLMARVKALKAEKNALSAEEGSLSAGRKTSGGNAVTVVETP